MTTSYGKISAVLLSSAAGLIASAGLASAANVTLLNGTTTTAVNSSGNYGTVWTAPVITTGSGDHAFGQNGYLFYATTPSGSSSGSYDYSGDTKYTAALDPMTLNGVTGQPGGVVTTTLLNTPSYLTLSDTAMNSQWSSGYGYNNIYARDGSAGNIVQSGTAYGPNTTTYNTPEQLVTMTVGSNAPKNLYIGVLEDHYYDSPSQVTISDSAGGSATANPEIYYPLTLTAGENTWYFFDVANAMPGDVISLTVAQYNTGQQYVQHPTVSGLTFDSTNPVSTPEPASLGLFALGGLGMLLLGRKRVIRKTA